jgi:hypothetical protein
VTAVGRLVDRRVPGYLGRVLDGQGEPVGTCFQVRPGVLVTASHVLDDIGSGEPDRAVQVDPLAGGNQFTAAVARVDRARDLAVLISVAGLPTTAGPLTATDEVVLREPVTVTGHAVLQDPGRRYRFLNASGEWAGGTIVDDEILLGRMTSSAVLPGMSGAPVVRESDGLVVGVVSARYNSADGWLTGTVWVIRTEDLSPLLAGITSATPQLSFSQPVDLVLTVSAGRVALVGPGIDVMATHGGIRPGLAEAVKEAERIRTSLSARAQAIGLDTAGELVLSRAGRLLGEAFLPEPVAAGLVPRSSLGS